LIKNIIFDLGNVLVNVEYERFINKILASGVTEERYKDFFKGANYRLLGYESGEITTEQFAKKCIEGLSLKMSLNEFSDSFNDMFSEISEMSRLVKELAESGKYGLFLLSNTSPLHFEYILKNYSYVNLLHKFALSYELKALKPNDEIYERTISHLNIDPEESLFIDDLPENCEAANEFGIKTICYDKSNHDDFRKQFDELLIINS
jgi:glucose-1-phosphatase